jgi:hypothetical protein
MSRPTLLIVDDHATFRATARALLEIDGWEVVGEAGDGHTGIAAAADLSPDGNGPAVIVTSSSDDPLYPARARENGAVGFVAKHDLSGAALQRFLG